ncbi:MAG: flagellin, partial [Bdellovibrionales bacterium]|nr:flagellin [Bdellovibrionales bacterium]
GDGFLDIVAGGYLDRGYTVLLGDGQGGFSDDTTTGLVGQGAYALAIGDLNEDGLQDVISVGPANASSVLIGNTRDGIQPLLEFSLATRADAKAALAPLERRLEDLSIQRGVIGAYQSRIASAVSTLGSQSENYNAAESRIRDADIANETSNLTRLQILQNAAAAVLSQANQQPALALQLL